MNALPIAEAALALSSACFVLGVVVSAHVIKIAEEAKEKAESILSAGESKVSKVLSDLK